MYVLDYCKHAFVSLERKAYYLENGNSTNKFSVIFWYPSHAAEAPLIYFFII